MPQPQQRKPCREFTTKGSCSFGNKCKYLHPNTQKGELHQQDRGARHHPYQKPNQQQQQNARQNDDGGHGPQRRGGRQYQQQQQQHPGMKAGQGNRQDGRGQQLQRKGSGAGGGTTPISPSDNYPLPPPPEDPAQQQQQQEQQQQQQQQPQRPQQPPAMTALGRARAMCKLLGIGNPGPLVTPETEAAAVKFFAAGAFFKETPFADSIESFLPPLKQQ